MSDETIKELSFQILFKHLEEAVENTRVAARNSDDDSLTKEYLRARHLVELIGDIAERAKLTDTGKYDLGEQLLNLAARIDMSGVGPMRRLLVPLGRLLQNGFEP